MATAQRKRTAVASFFIMLLNCRVEGVRTVRTPLQGGLCGRDKGFGLVSQANRRVVYSKLIATVRLMAWRGTDELRLAKDRKYWMIVSILRHLHPQDSTWLDNLCENA